MFRKIASVRSLGSAEVDDHGFLKLASGGSGASRVAETSSYYLDGSRQIPVSELLQKVAELYAVSPDPRDYLWEAIRANTTNVPNENDDGFHQSELLRFDTRLGMPVYMTYAGKPHHVNHKTDNPKSARGVVIDSHYHDIHPPLESCPRCANHTALRQNRDETGIHCRRCGQVVRDEFVEILVGVDTKKDPIFAKGVRTGQLDAGSMGCNCLSTVCNVCGHVAYSRPEFCEHIRAGNKGTLWKRQGSLWTRVSPHEVRAQAQKRGYIFDPVDFCYLVTPDGFEVRKAYEYCQQVVFDEYSRVDQPADPKARSREILKAASVVVPAGLVPSPAELQAETELLIRSAEAHRRRASRRVAMQFVVVRLGGDDTKIAAGETLEEACDHLGLDAPDEAADDLEVQEGVEAESPLEAQQMFDPAKARAYKDARTEIIPLPAVQPGEDILLQMPEQPAPAPGGPETTPIEEYQEDQMPAAPEEESGTPAEPLGLAEMGVQPPGGAMPPAAPKPGVASAPPRHARRRPPMFRFANTYRGWTVEVSPQGNARVLTARQEPVLVIRGRAEPDPKKRYAFGRQIMESILTDGVIATAKKARGIFTPKVAQVVDGAIDDMKEFADKYMHDSVLEDETTDMQESRAQPPSKVPDEYSDDMEGQVRGKPSKSTQDDGDVDHTEGKPGGVDSVTQEDNTDMREKRDKLNLGSDSVLDDETHDHTERLARLTRVGARIVHKSQPKLAWTVRIAALTKTGEIEVSIAADGQRPRRVGEKDLMEYWRSLDTPPKVRWAAGQIQQLRQAGITAEVVDGKLRVTPPKADAQTAKKISAYEQRVKKAWSAKEEKLKKAHARELDLVKTGAVQSFCRAMRIVAARQSADLEASPLKQAAIQTFASPRALGQEANGDVIEYQGMDPALVRHLVAEVYQHGHPDHLENLMVRAAELASKGDQYLLDAEADARNLQAALPPITAALVRPPDPVALRAAQVRQAAMGGNLQVNSGPPAETVPGNGFDKRSAIRGAVQGTMVNSTLGRLRAMDN